MEIKNILTLDKQADFEKVEINLWSDEASRLHQKHFTHLSINKSLSLSIELWRSNRFLPFAFPNSRLEHLFISSRNFLKTFLSNVKAQRAPEGDIQRRQKVIDIHEFFDSCCQYYKASKKVNYDSRVINIINLLVIMTLEG